MTDFVQDVWDASENGLPHPGVTAIRQTRDGYLWIATFTGVVRFDGVSFHPPQVDSAKARTALQDHVRGILEANDGAMWFSTRRQGVVRVKDGVAEMFEAKDGLASTDVRQMAQTKDGTMFFATGAGVTVRDPAGRFRTLGTAEGLPHVNVVTLYHDVDDSVWVGTGTFGVARYDGQRFQPVVLPIPKELPRVEQAFGLPLRSVGALARDDQGVLWAGTAVGILQVPEKGRVSPPLIPGAVNGMAKGRRGVWVSTSAGLGLLTGEGFQKYTSQEGLLNDGLMAVVEDREGSLWVGSRIGLARLRPRAIRTYTQRDGVGHDTVNCVLAARNGDVWVGHKRGVSRLRDGVWETLGVEEGLPNLEVRALAEGADGAIWIGTLDGFARHHDGRIKTYRGQSAENYSVRSLAFDAEGRLWITGEGIDRLDGDKVVRVIARDNKICDWAIPNYLHMLKDGWMLVGTNSGLMRVHADGRSECFKEKDVLARNDVRNIYEDAQGTLWVGSIGGISRFTERGRENLVGASGPFNTAVYALQDDGLGGFWASTPKGLFRIEKAKIGQHGDADAALSIYRSFGTADGMDTPVGTGGGQPTSARSSDGRLWFATATGVAMVDPKTLEVDTVLPPVYVERLLADRQPVDVKRAARLAAGTRDVELHFALLSFVSPEQAHYKYRLSGYDRGWVESGSRRAAYYSNLSPGRYRFEVLAANHNGVWAKEPAALEFELAPHFYQRRWFMPLLALLAVAAGVGIHRYRVAALRAHEVALQKRVDETVASLQVLRGLLPICASCRRVREDAGSWRQIEAYVMEHSEATFSHGMCPDCWEKLRQEEPNLPAYRSDKN